MKSFFLRGIFIFYFLYACNACNPNGGKNSTQPSIYNNQTEQSTNTVFGRQPSSTSTGSSNANNSNTTSSNSNQTQNSNFASMLVPGLYTFTNTLLSNNCPNNTLNATVGSIRYQLQEITNNNGVWQLCPTSSTETEINGNPNCMVFNLDSNGLFTYDSSNTYDSNTLMAIDNLSCPYSYRFTSIYQQPYDLADYFNGTITQYIFSPACSNNALEANGYACTLISQSSAVYGSSIQ